MLPCQALIATISANKNSIKVLLIVNKYDIAIDSN
jgi:hypothetical protein